MPATLTPLGYRVVYSHRGRCGDGDVHGAVESAERERGEIQERLPGAVVRVLVLYDLTREERGRLQRMDAADAVAEKERRIARIAASVPEKERGMNDGFEKACEQCGREFRTPSADMNRCPKCRKDVKKKGKAPQRDLEFEDA